MATLTEELLDVVGRLPDAQQRLVLDYARALTAPSRPPSPPPPSKPASDFLAFRPSMPPEDAEEMRRAIEEGCETIEPDDDLSL